MDRKAINSKKIKRIIRNTDPKWRAVKFLVYFVIVGFLGLALTSITPKKDTEAILQKPIYANSDEQLLTEKQQLELGLASESSLAKKDNSGVFDATEDELEVVSDRTEQFKKFKDNTNTYRVAGQIGPIHYKEDPYSQDEVYKEIDLTIDTGKNNDYGSDYYMDNNGYQAYFWNKKESSDGAEASYVARFVRAGKWIEMSPAGLYWENSLGERELISTPKGTIAPDINNENYYISWKNVFGEGIDFRYNVNSDKFFKTVIINSKESLPAATISGEGLKLTVVMAMAWDNSAKADNNFAKDTDAENLSINENDVKAIIKDGNLDANETLENPTEF